MESPIPQYLADLITATADFTQGAVADYIPELAQTNPDQVAIALATVDGVIYAQGDVNAQFTMQSMSKPLTFGLALADHGIEGVERWIGVEPSGEGYNQLSLEPGTGRPRNPMINAGAIAAHALVAAGSASERLQRIVDFYSAFANRELTIDETVARSELSTAHRNLAIGHLLRASEIIEADPASAVDGYIRQCAVSVNVSDIALMAATLANSGVQPRTGERVLDQYLVRHVLSVMLSSGMYDSAGDWLTSVGIPAKSGVSGGIIGVLPGQVGIAVFSPRLDSHGTSVRGVELMRRLSRDMDLHVMDAPRPARSAVREVRETEYEGQPATVYELNGDLVFSSQESLIRRLVDDPPTTELVIFDLDRVDEITDIARRMATEATQALDKDGYEIALFDPAEKFPGIKLASGRAVRYLPSLGV